MDPFGDSLMCARLPGDTWRTKHDAVKITLANFCHEARLAVNVEVYGTFSADIPAAATAEDGSLMHIRDRQGLVPDFMFRMPNPSGPPSDLLADVKGINAGRTWYTNRDKQVDVRARRVNTEYRRALKKIDIRYHGVGDDEIGPLQARLATYGTVQGLVFGVLGEGSQHLHELLQQIASARSSYVARMRGRDLSDSEYGQLLHSFRRRLSCVTVAAQAQCLLSRIGHRGQGARSMPPEYVGTWN